MRKLTGLTIFAGLLAAAASSQQSQLPKFAEPQAMPTDRAAESYEIYSKLLVGGPIEWRDAKRSQWLVEDTTYATPLNEVCKPIGPGPVMDPHNAVQPPAERKAEWLELLADFDNHCHDVIKLEAVEFHVKLPVRVLDEAARKRYRTEQGARKAEAAGPQEFPDAAGLHSFSEVYFNPHHTLALVRMSMWCRGLCGMSSWVVLERKDGVWKRLPWVHYSMIS